MIADELDDDEEASSSSSESGDEEDPIDTNRTGKQKIPL
jgi:hypothetical protein